MFAAEAPAKRDRPGVVKRLPNIVKEEREGRNKRVEDPGYRRVRRNSVIVLAVRQTQRGWRNVQSSPAAEVQASQAQVADREGQLRSQPVIYLSVPLICIQPTRVGPVYRE